MMQKALAEFIGTFTLVLFGCGSVVFAADQVGVLGISFAFGIAIIAMAYGIGPISGCHVNPAVSVGAWFAGRLPTSDLVPYIIAQVAGAIVASLVLVIILGGKISGYSIGTAGLGQNGWGASYGGGYNLMAAFVFEVVATFIFLVVILGSTGKKAAPGFAGLAIGFTLVAIHIIGIRVTGVSVNPARSLGPALFVGGTALAQVWLFIVAPLIGAIAAGALFKAKLLED